MDCPTLQHTMYAIAFWYWKTIPHNRYYIIFQYILLHYEYDLFDITITPVLPGSYLLHLGQEGQMWAKHLVQGPKIKTMSKDQTKSLSCESQDKSLHQYTTALQSK